LLNGNIKGLPPRFAEGIHDRGLDPEVKASVDAAVKQLQSLGASVEEISLHPHRPRGGDVLHHRPGRSLGEPGARLMASVYGARVDGADPIEAVQQDARRGFWAGSEAPHHPRHLRLSSGYYDAIICARKKYARSSARIF